MLKGTENDHPILGVSHTQGSHVEGLAKLKKSKEEKLGPTFIVPYCKVSLTPGSHTLGSECS